MVSFSTLEILFIFFEDTKDEVVSSISNVSSTLSPNVLILAEYIETSLSLNTWAILPSNPGLSDVSIVKRFLPFCGSSMLVIEVLFLKLFMQEEKLMTILGY